MKHAFAVLVFFVLAACAAAQEFSAKIVWPDQKNTTGTLYVSGSHFRADIVHDGELNVALLEAGKKPKLTVISPSEKTYSVLSLSDEPELVELTRWLSTPEKELCDMPGLRSCKFLGLNTSEDRVCDQFEVVDKDGESHQVCFDHDLHFGLTISSKGESITLTDLKFGKQPSWLFVVPKKFKMKSFF